MLAVDGDTCTVTFDGTDFVVIVTVAVPVFDVSFCDVAIITTCAGVGTVAGAVYSPVLEIVPFALPPATVHVTAVLNVSVTVALNCSVFPITTFTPVGSTVTPTTFPAVPRLASREHQQKRERDKRNERLLKRVRRFVTVPGRIGRHSRCREPLS